MVARSRNDDRGRRRNRLRYAWTLPAMIRGRGPRCRELCVGRRAGHGQGHRRRHHPGRRPRMGWHDARPLDPVLPDPRRPRREVASGSLPASDPAPACRCDRSCAPTSGGAPTRAAPAGLFGPLRRGVSASPASPSPPPTSSLLLQVKKLRSLNRYCATHVQSKGARSTGY